MKSAGTDGASVRHRKPNRVYQFLDRHLVGKSDSADYTDKWRQKFAKHPTWCDADMALQQINAGKADGNRVALYARALFQRILYNMGHFVQCHPIKILIFMIVCMGCCFSGLQYVTIEVDIVKLWVSQGGRLDEELNFRSFATEQYAESKRHKRDAPGVPPVPNPIKPIQAVTAAAPEIPRENGLGGGFQVVIQTPEHEGENVVAREGLLRHVKIMEEIAQYKVEMHGANWTLADICFKPPAPTLPPGTLNAAVGTLLERIIPCIWITPIDCFWEGAKPLGPHPALELGEEVSAFIASIPKGKVTWKNLNPSAVINEVSTLLDLGTIKNFFDRAGIGAAYLDRPCIDPLDHECPKDAPNYFDRCTALEKFDEWNGALDDENKIALAEEIIPVTNPIPELNLIGDLLGRKKRQANESENSEETETTTAKTASATTPASTNSSKGGKKDDDDEYYNYSDDDDYKNAGSQKQAAEDPKAIRCKKFGKDLLRWMQENPKKWDAFLPKSAQPAYPDYGKIMTGGCAGFGKNIMKWPEDLIIGGIKRENNTITSAEAFQSVFLVAGAQDVFQRHRGAKTKEFKPNFNPATWNPSKANEIVTAWQRNFTSHIYAHHLNKPEENLRVVHPLASTSIADMLEEFSQFQFFVIFIGYVLMILYAGSTQFDWKGWWFSVKSATGIAIFGVLLITFSSVAGLGFSSAIGINFNAATTQIVPFLTLGLGIDDMFLLMHNYQDLLLCVRDREIAVLMKETGMSILITSTNNILAFLAGIVLPIPALRSFCSQTAILLMFNLFTTMILFPALMAIDVKRRKSNRRDMTPPGCGSKVEIVPAESTANVITAESNNKDPKDYPWYTLESFLHNHYLPLLHKKPFKIFIVTLCGIMFLSGCVGLWRSKLGLELADVLPEGTAPSAFLKAREKYFSFYPMFSVLKGPGIDYPNQQMKIEELRNEIAKSDFVIKVEGKPSEPYWMSLMRIWLESLQVELDKGLASGVIDPVNGSLYIKSTTDERVNDEMLLARRLVCSYGTKFNCTGRISMVKLVDKDGIINPEGFYNYLTAWFHVDNMMYYVSQAAFFPTPPAWGFDPWAEAIVPAAEPLYYSQIPFYLTNLIDTPYIVDMIKEIRATSEQFTAEGLPNFPTGLAFTFWEQYLHLTKNLTTAILIIGSSVLLVISLLIFNPWAASMVAIVVVSMTIELAGFMGLFGVKMNPISAVTLITAVGIGVEFTAHVVLAYLSSLGTRDERMEAAMEHMFIPVLHGCLSTLLGIIMLAFSEFDFVVKYFFVVMTALILIGLFNGVAMLPVMLSFIGPPCEIHPLDGSALLPPPPPLNKQKKKRAAGGLALAEDGDVKLSKRDLAKLDTDSSGPSSPSIQDSGDDEAVTISKVPPKTDA
uniref:SSD domain-containing protein n=1 Tax=Panagrellus redivivus TaxID=6233 RepID=A0A7E4VNZ3_PANRE